MRSGISSTLKLDFGGKAVLAITHAVLGIVIAIKIGRPEVWKAGVLVGYLPYVLGHQCNIDARFYTRRTHCDYPNAIFPRSYLECCEIRLGEWSVAIRSSRQTRKPGAGHEFLTEI